MSLLLISRNNFRGSKFHLLTEKDSYSEDAVFSNEMANDEGKQEILKYISEIIERLNRKLK